MIKLTFVGDIMCEKPLLKAAKQKGGDYDFSSLFCNTKSLFSESDYLIGNLETPLAGKAERYTNALYSFNTPDEFASALKEAGFSLIATANNHCLDRGLTGLKRTNEILDANGIQHTGTWITPKARKEGCYFTTNGGINIAIITYTYGTNYAVNHFNLSEEEEVMVNLLHPYHELVYGAKVEENKISSLKRTFGRFVSEEKKIRLKKVLHRRYNTPREDNYLNEKTVRPYIEKLKKDIALAKTKADIIIFYPHIGGQFNIKPGKFTEYIFNEVLKMGVDAIIGSHPHIVQKARIISGVPCYYSIGNYSISPSSVYLLHEHLPEYGLAVHLYIEKKIVSSSFSVLKMVEEKNKVLTVYPVDEYAALLQDATDLEKLKREMMQIYTTVSGKVIHNEFVLQKEYIL